jgi:Asp-tRNA(Asn)/Glu-tRNA(Gln) amidotransferase A subunit family amidase
LPIGHDKSGLPLGMQLAGPTDADAHLLSVASWCEERLPFVGLG